MLIINQAILLFHFEFTVLNLNAISVEFCSDKLRHDFILFQFNYVNIPLRYQSQKFSRRLFDKL